MRTLQSELVEKRIHKKKDRPIKRKSKKHKNPSIERFSRRDLEELMGTKRDTFKKVRGSFRRK